MTTLETTLRSPSDPALLTIADAAHELRIGRTLAYQLARLYLATDEREGLPVIHVGSTLRVPRWALIELAQTGRVVSLRDTKPPA